MKGLPQTQGRRFMKIGNSRVILWDGKKSFKIWSTQKFHPAQAMNSRNRFQELWICSVVPHLTKKVQIMAQTRGIRVHTIRSQDIPIHPAYSKIGIDRLLNVFAATRLTTESFVVIDFGTAITVDFFDAKKKRHLGGWITAGPKILAQALARETALLPFIQLERAHLGKTRTAALKPGKDTKSSLISGQLAYLRGIKNEAQKFAESRLSHSSNVKIYVTGGWSQILRWSGMCSVPNLTLEGLAFISRKISLRSSR